MLTKWLWMTFQLLSPTSREILLSLTAFRKKRSTWHSSCHSSLVVHTPAHLPFCHFPNASSLRVLHVHVAVFLPFSSPLRYRFLREDSVGLVSVSLTSLLFSTALSALGYFCVCPPSPSGTYAHMRIEPISWLVQHCIPSANFFCNELDSK